MKHSELIARLMSCDPEKIGKRSLLALAKEIETRTRGDEGQIERTLAGLGYRKDRLHYTPAARGR